MAEGGGLADVGWRADLELALSQPPDTERLRELCRGREIPPELRADVWKVCLHVVGKPDALGTWDGLMDLCEQDLIRKDCRQQAAKLNLSEYEEEEIARDMEGVITFYCKSRNEKYKSLNGWAELLRPFMGMDLSMSDVYNCFYAMQTKYIPRDCFRDGKPFHLLRLLLQYHDPELCSFLDSRKLSPDTYAQRWMRSLFVPTCEMSVIQAMWDIYLVEEDPFLMFFLILVMIINTRDQLFEMEHESRTTILETLSSLPCQLQAEDVEDFCALAQYYSSRTPQSIRKDYFSQLFGIKTLPTAGLSQELCLQTTIPELLEANQSNSRDGVRFFVVDCRPAEQYNSGHLPTAFHLDANLMLQAPSEFATAVQALFATQKQSIAAASIAGGEHLCFMGSGREEEDQYVHMVIANFLQKKAKYVSICKGGYQALHEVFADELSSGLVDHSPHTCIVCTPSALSDDESFHELARGDQSPDGGLVGKLSSVLRTRGANVRDKLGHFMDSGQPVERHVSSSDRLGKRYRDVKPVFSLTGDEEEEPDDHSLSSSEDEGRREAVSIDTWLKRKDVLHSFPSNEILQNGQMCPSYILVTENHMFVLREIVNKKGMASIQYRHPLSSVVKITSKKRHPDLITFKFGYAGSDHVEVTLTQRFLIPKASKATKKIRDRILQVVGDQEVQ